MQHVRASKYHEAFYVSTPRQLLAQSPFKISAFFGQFSIKNEILICHDRWNGISYICVLILRVYLLFSDIG
jgi:hypothetical protein